MVAAQAREVPLAWSRMVEVDGAEPGRCQRDQADGIGAAAKRLKRPLDKPAVGRADDGRALLNQIAEGAVVQADDLGSVWRRLVHRSRSESQAIEYREHPGASIRDLGRPWARLLGEVPSGRTARGGGTVGPVLPL